MNNIFSKDGRLDRVSYQSFFVSSLLLGLFNTYFFGIWDYQYSIWLIIGLISSIYLYLITIFAMAKRCHDLDKSGWEFLKSLIPIYNIYFLFILLFSDGTIGGNRYGKNPTEFKENDESWYWAIQYYMATLFIIFIVFAFYNKLIK